MKRPTPNRYEGSPADKPHDRMEAKKHGMSMKSWEGSAMDKKMDRAGQKKLDMKGKKGR